MAIVTCCVVLPFVRDEDRNRCPDGAIECQSSAGAVTKARALASAKAGAIRSPGRSVQGYPEARGLIATFSATPDQHVAVIVALSYLDSAASAAVVLAVALETTLSSPFLASPLVPGAHLLLVSKLALALAVSLPFSRAAKVNSRAAWAEIDGLSKQRTRSQETCRRDCDYKRPEHREAP